MSDKFAASMYQTYVSATLGSLVSQATMRGVTGASGPIDFQDSLYSGLMTGTAFIAYPVACDILKKKSASFKRSFEDPKACKAPVPSRTRRPARRPFTSRAACSAPPSSP